MFIGKKPELPINYENNEPEINENYENNEPEESEESENVLPEGMNMDRESLSYQGKTFEKGDTVKFSTKKEGVLVKIGKRVIIVLRNDTHKERRLKVAQFIKYNF